MTDLILLLQADLDIQTAFERYEDYQPGRGEVFIRQLDAAFTLLRRHPEIAPVTGYQHAKCYARSDSNCSSKISKEHYISETLLRWPTTTR